jgi:hypothetical protein
MTQDAGAGGKPETERDVEFGIRIGGEDVLGRPQIRRCLASTSRPASLFTSIDSDRLPRFDEMKRAENSPALSIAARLLIHRRLGEPWLVAIVIIRP